MLKLVTHKLRTHSLNEDTVSEKVEGRDSGTESDDEADRRDDHGDFCTDVIMKWNDDVTDINVESAGAACACGPARARAARLLPPPEPDLLYDHHSSEEELEVINMSVCAAPVLAARLESRRRAASSPPPAAPEKRRWTLAPASYPRQEDSDSTARTLSSDDDDTKVETPVRFRTSPPLEALKPRRVETVGASAGGGVSAVPGAAGCLCARADARRRRVALPPRRHRPALDFDKMQQLKVGGTGRSSGRPGGAGAGAGAGATAGATGVRSWRAVGGAHGGELSVFCW